MKQQYVTGYIIHRIDTQERTPVVGPVLLTEALLVKDSLSSNKNFDVEIGSIIKIQKKKKVCNKIDILTILKGA